eukprot:195868_1
MLNFTTETVMVPQNLIGIIIGQPQKNLERIREQSGVLVIRVDRFSNNKRFSPDCQESMRDERGITIIGTLNSVATAKMLLNQHVRQQSEIWEAVQEKQNLEKQLHMFAQQHAGVSAADLMKKHTSPISSHDKSSKTQRNHIRNSRSTKLKRNKYVEITSSNKGQTTMQLSSTTIYDGSKTALEKSQRKLKIPDGERNHLESTMKEETDELADIDDISRLSVCDKYVQPTDD